MKKLLYKIIFFTILNVLAISISLTKTHDFLAHEDEETSFIEEEYDEFDSIADKQTKEGFKSSLGSSSKGLLGWFAMNVRRAGTSMVLSYATAQEWVGWFKYKVQLAWLWVKNKAVAKK